jgi:ABC-2 type transport system ATP-binding protein
VRDRTGADLGPAVAIEVRGLIKTYGSIEAVAGIDLQIKHGEVFALLGPNGAGKTTTVEILEGYRRRDSGDGRVLGLEPGRQWARCWSTSSTALCGLIGSV